jgi:hypothetical protein
MRGREQGSIVILPSQTRGMRGMRAMSSARR